MRVILIQWVPINNNQLIFGKESEMTESEVIALSQKYDIQLLERSGITTVWLDIKGKRHTCR